jgi:hypothetical protein
MAKEGLAERVQLFFMPDPKWRPTNAADPSYAAATRGADAKAGGGEANNPQPVILALPASLSPDVSVDEARAGIRRASIFFTSITTCAYSVGCYALIRISLIRSSTVETFFRCYRLASPSRLRLRSSEPYTKWRTGSWQPPAVSGSVAPYLSRRPR